MVIALFALSLAMIIGGIASVVQGFPYVRLESGLAMVIGGTTAASAGVVLLGLGAVVMQLRRVESLLGARLDDRQEPAREAPPLDAAFRAPALETAPPIPTVPRPRLAGAAGLAGVTLGAVAADAHYDGVGGGSGRNAEAAAAQEPLLPDLLPPEEPALAGPDEDLFALPEDRPGRGVGAISEAAKVPGEPIEQSKTAALATHETQEEFALRPALDETAASPVAGPTPPMEEPPPAAADEPKPERHAVGSYASGGNTYVMFSDGTIDAETPRGRFTFQSLDELKDFVASGEAGERGAA